MLSQGCTNIRRFTVQWFIKISKAEKNDNEVVASSLHQKENDLIYLEIYQYKMYVILFIKTPYVISSMPPEWTRFLS